MKVIRIDDVPKEPSANVKLFTGPVTGQSIVGKNLSSKHELRQVHFGKGVRNKFHSHSSEQILIVTEGKGIVATEKEKITVTPGDVIVFGPGEKHWHGAAEGSTFSHLYVMAPDQKTVQLED